MQYQILKIQYLTSTSKYQRDRLYTSNTIPSIQNINAIPYISNRIPYVKIQSITFILYINTIPNTYNSIPYVNIQIST